MNDNEMAVKEVGTVSIHMYKDIKTDYPFFYIKSENKEVLPLSYIIEDTLKMY